jgi:hypothetical protein
MDQSRHIFLHNSTLEEVVTSVFTKEDTVQLIPRNKVHLPASLVPNATCIEIPDEYCNIQIHRLGLFGLISPRTRLSAGYGFHVKHGETYRVLLIEGDSNGNLCSLRNDDPQKNAPSSIKYKFGDMFIKPIMKSIGFETIPITQVDTNTFTNYRNQQKQRQVSRTAAVSTTSMQNINENEIWALFFNQSYETGLWALETKHYIAEDDLYLQEPFLFIGIPSLTLLNTILRSIDDPNALIFIDGRRISKDKCPETFLKLYELLTETKIQLRQLPPLTENEITWLQQFLLFSGSDKIISCNVS